MVLSTLMNGVPSAVVSRRGAARWQRGHPWIYASDVMDSPEAPGIVTVRNEQGKFLGQALCSPRSEIRLRLLERSDRAIGPAWWRERITASAERRAGIDATAWRVVHGEGDGLPSLIVDRYDRWLVVQLLSAGIDENPFVYKDIHQVMAQQDDLVEVVARFDPRIDQLGDLLGLAGADHARNGREPSRVRVLRLQRGPLLGRI